MIRAISYHLPELCLTNQELAQLYPSWPADKIFEKTGIRTRHIAAPDETASDLAALAARKLFAEHAIAPASIEFLIFCTQSPDYCLPTTACALQHKLGVPSSAGAFDFNLGCSGYVYGLGIAKGLIAGGMARRILLLTGDTYSKYIYPMDQSTRTLFGDGASATLIEASDEPNGIGGFVFGTDGAGAGNLIVPASGARKVCELPEQADGGVSSACPALPRQLYMNGPAIFNFTLDVVPPALEKVLQMNGLKMDNVDLFVFHQANKFMLEMLRRKTRIPQDKFYVNIEDCGNTVSSSIPIALARAAADGTLKRGMRVVLVGFGVGLSWGATVISW